MAQHQRQEARGPWEGKPARLPRRGQAPEVAPGQAPTPAQSSADRPLRGAPSRRWGAGLGLQGRGGHLQTPPLGITPREQHVSWGRPVESWGSCGWVPRVQEFHCSRSLTERMRPSLAGNTVSLTLTTVSIVPDHCSVLSYCAAKAATQGTGPGALPRFLGGEGEKQHKRGHWRWCQRW